MPRSNPAPIRVEPDRRLVFLISYAIDQVTPKLRDRKQWAPWLEWADSWKSGRHSPAACVSVAHQCFENKGNPIGHTLGQIAWGAKEACYSTPKSGWLVIRYIADAMVAFSVAYPEQGVPLLDPPTIDGTAREIKAVART